MRRELVIAVGTKSFNDRIMVGARLFQLEHSTLLVLWTGVENTPFQLTSSSTVISESMSP
jgi:hypothetical protein